MVQVDLMGGTTNLKSDGKKVHLKIRKEAPVFVK